MKTTAAVLRAGNGPFSIEELDLGPVGPHEVRVRVVAAGMCHTDLLSRELPPEFFGGPQVYGHEGAGVVEEIGSAVTSVSVGDHVVLSFNSCGSCPSCRKRRYPYCFDFSLYNMSGGRPDGTSSLTAADGSRVGSHYFGQSSFSSRAVVAETSVVPVDRSYDLKNLGPLGCGIQTGAGAILNTLAVEAGSSVVITGAGALGLSAVMAAKVAKASTIIAVDRHASRLGLATKYGATHVTASSGPTDDITGAIREITGHGSDYAFDTTGNAAVVRASHAALNVTGTIALAGVGFGDLTVDFLSMISGRTITGVMEGDSIPREFIPHLAALNARGDFPFHELITEFPLDRINEAEAASTSGAVIKPVLIMP